MSTTPSLSFPEVTWLTSEGAIGLAGLHLVERAGGGHVPQGDIPQGIGGGLQGGVHDLPEATRDHGSRLGGKELQAGLGPREEWLTSHNTTGLVIAASILKIIKGPT